MGLSASQARLLNLTARMHDIEYKAQNLEAQKLQMANESQQVYSEYETALNKTKIQQKGISNESGAIFFKNVTAADLKDAGYSFEIAVGDDTIKGTVYSTMDKAIKKLSEKKLIDDTGAFVGTNEQVTNFINEGYIVLVKVVDKDNKRVENFADGDSLKNIQGTEATSGSYEVNVATDTGLQEVTDEVDLKKAEAKYESDMRKINNKDAKFDTDLAALESERNAIKTEMETLKSVAKDNVDRTYKLFS